MAKRVVRVLPLGGQWEELGVDRWRGIEPVGLNPKADEGGPTDCTFTIPRPTDRLHADLQALTPAEVYINEKLVWSGKIRETPAQGGLNGEITVQGFGYQRNLDEDQYRRLFCHQRLSEYVDARSFTDTDLNTYTAAYQVSTGQRGIMMALPAAATAAAGKNALVVLDLGPGVTAKRVVVTYKGGGGGALSLYTHGGDKPSSLDESSQIDPAPIATTSTTVGFTFAKARRYVGIRLANTSGASKTGDETTWVQITSVLVVADTAYESGNASILKATDVWKDMLTHCRQLDQSTALIAQTAFGIPDLYEIAAPQTPRVFKDRANSYHKYQVRARADKKLECRPLPSVPLFEVKDASAFDDASVSSAADIVNKVIVSGQGGDGVPLEVVRYASEVLSGVAIETLTTPTFLNAGFEGNPLTPWTADPGGTFTQTTTAGQFRSGAAGARWSGATRDQIMATAPQVGGTFKKGVTYVAAIYVKAASTCALQLYIGQGGVDETGWRDVGSADSSGFKQFRITWTPRSDIASASVNFYVSPVQGASGSIQPDIYFDDFSLGKAAATIADQRGDILCQNLQVRAATDAATMQVLADAYLKSHQVTPMRGTLTAVAGGVGDSTVTWLKGGGPVDPSELLLNTCELILFSTLIDPATAARGRVGMIQNADYDEPSESAKVAIDSSRDNLEALLARMDVVVGAGQ